jgi:hypothetical protein
MADDQNLYWRRSSYGDSGPGVEVAITDEWVHVRNAAEPDGPWLTFSRRDWAAFLDSLKHE